jgi:hypothetical protein
MATQFGCLGRHSQTLVIPIFVVGKNYIRAPENQVSALRTVNITAWQGELQFMCTPGDRWNAEIHGGKPN